MHSQQSIKHAAVELEMISWHYVCPAEQSWFHALTRATADVVLVKSATRRSVFRLSRGIYVKEVCYSGLRSMAKTVSGGNACREGKILLELARRGIPVPEVIAFGSEHQSGMLRRDVLLSNEVPNAMSLRSLLHGAYQHYTFAEKSKLAKDFAGFVKLLHEKGVFHRDLNIGNILVQAGNGLNRFVLLDVDRVKLKSKALNPEERLLNLAILLCNFWSLGSSTQLLRFLAHYGPSGPGEQKRRVLHDIKRRALNLARSDQDSHARQCLSTNKRFVAEHDRDFSIYRKQGNDIVQLLRQLLPDPDQIMGRGEMLDHCGTAEAGKVYLGGRPYFLQRYSARGWVHTLTNMVRRSRARRTWLVSWGFRVRDLPVPEPLICLEERRFRLLRRAYLLYEFIDHAERLSDVWSTLSESAKKRLLARLAMVLGCMHRFGGYHGDLQWQNILIRSCADREEIILTGLDRSSFRSPRSAHGPLKDLQSFFRDLEQQDRSEAYRDFFLQSWRKWSR